MPPFILLYFMGSNKRKEQLKKFLNKFDEPPIVFFQNNHSIGPMQEFLLTYFGKCFIQGYRIIEKIDDNVFILSLMEYQHGGNLNFTMPKDHQQIKHAKYKIISVEFNQKKINQDRQIRQQHFKKIQQISQFFCSSKKQIQNCQGVEIHFIFADNFQYSNPSFETLIKGSPLALEKFYKPKQQQKGGLKTLNEKQQGIKLHQIVQLLLKGAGEIRNKKYLSKSILHQCKFSYSIWRVINTIYLIVGNYITISSQKWMRKFSQKKFKKFDLLLRNQKKVCIIDWKFSRINANEKIGTQAFAQKNLQYFRLARQQYNAEVQLKFYCFHKTYQNNHHKFTFANYNYNIEKIDIEDHIIDNGIIQIDSDSSIDISYNPRHIQNRLSYKKQEEFFQEDEQQQKGMERFYSNLSKFHQSHILNRFQFNPSEIQQIVKKQREKQKQKLIQQQRKRRTSQYVNINYDLGTQTFILSNHPKHENDSFSIKQTIQQEKQKLFAKPVSKQRNIFNRISIQEFPIIQFPKSKKYIESIQIEEQCIDQQNLQDQIKINQNNQQNKDQIQNKYEYPSKNENNLNQNINYIEIEQSNESSVSLGGQIQNNNENVRYKKIQKNKKTSKNKKRQKKRKRKQKKRQQSESSQKYMPYMESINISSSSSQASSYQGITNQRMKHKSFAAQNRKQIEKQKKRLITPLNSVKRIDKNSKSDILPNVNNCLEISINIRQDKKENKLTQTSRDEKHKNIIIID